VQGSLTERQRFAGEVSAGSVLLLNSAVRFQVKVWDC
jgi:hypothetical protein